MGLALAAASCGVAAGSVAPGTPTTGSPPPAQARDDTWPVLYRRASAASGRTIDLRAVGDLMFAREVAESAQQRGDDDPLREVRGLLAGDIVVGNLESPLTSLASARAGPFRLPAPPRFANALRDSGFTALSLANNHALDAGPRGLEDSVASLTSAGVASVGVGISAQAARQPARLEEAGLRVALLAFNDVLDPADQPRESESWGRAWLDQDALSQVGEVRSAADLVVVLVHWGEEYARNPSARQRAWARDLVDAGADVVIGSHPHVLQRVETPLAGDGSGRIALVAYSLGNFVFDQDFSRETRTSAVLRLVLDAQGVAAASFAPVEMVKGRVRPLPFEGPGSRWVRARLAAGPP